MLYELELPVGFKDRFSESVIVTYQTRRLCASIQLLYSHVMKPNQVDNSHCIFDSFFYVMRNPSDGHLEDLEFRMDEKII